MSRWSSDRKQRHSKKYIATHAALAFEVTLDTLELRHARHQARSNQFRAKGAVDDTGDSETGRRRALKVQR